MELVVEIPDLVAGVSCCAIEDKKKPYQVLR
jgi:hypothetical protein